MFGINFSLEAILLIYMNRISNPPINIRKRIIVIQDFSMFNDIKIVDKVVCVSRRIPIDIGVFKVGMIHDINIIPLIIIILISTNILIKILVLDIKDIEILFCWSFKGFIPNFSLQD